MILVPRPFSILQILWTSIISKFSLSIHYANSSSMGVVSSPLLQRLQQMLPHFVLIEQAVSRMFSICKRCGKGNCKKATVGSKGDRQQQGGPGTCMAAIFGPGGLIILPWTVRGHCFRGGTVHGVTCLVVIILRSGMKHSENTKQLCKSSLQCLISVSCISLDRAQQPLHAGTYTAETWELVLVLWPEVALRELPPSCLHIQFFLDTRIWATRVPAYRAQLALSSDMQLTEIRHCNEELHVAVPCSLCVPFRSVK